MESTEQMLLRAILDDPANDGARGAYADWLEENGDEARSTFIRVSVALANCPSQLPPGTDMHAVDSWDMRFGVKYALNKKNGWDGVTTRAIINPRYDALKRLERELLKAHEGSWADVLPQELVTKPCPRCVDKAPDWETNVVECRACDSMGIVENYDGIEWQRGFIAGIELSCAAFMEHAASVFASQPIERVTLSDKRPLPQEDGSFRWLHRVDSQLGLPKEIIVLLPTGSTCTRIRNAGEWASEFSIRDYDSEESALEALSIGCVAYGRRSLAGLPPLPAKA